MNVETELCLCEVLLNCALPVAAQQLLTISTKLKSCLQNHTKPSEFLYRFIKSYVLTSARFLPILSIFYANKSFCLLKPLKLPQKYIVAGIIIFNLRLAIIFDKNQIVILYFSVLNQSLY